RHADAARGGGRPEKGAARDDARAGARPLALVLNEPQRTLGARDDAEAARLAGVGARCVRALLAVREHLELREERERGPVGVVDAAHLEDLVRADLDAIALTLATRAVDDGTPPTRRRATLLTR